MSIDAPRPNKVDSIITDEFDSGKFHAIVYLPNGYKLYAFYEIQTDMLWFHLGTVLPDEYLIDTHVGVNSWDDEPDKYVNYDLLECIIKGTDYELSYMEGFRSPDELETYVRSKVVKLIASKEVK